ncbi:hypothetical protein [Nitrosococcus watsonii]|uniref:DUF2393 domain-containing protein n=1 Tax=Nitrosococcus watsoni (strain C-113) TaxID=105559 RepID=D8K656_NITWC|nr:hypothetical protein [Nitrosococcus watsonii]ADJ28383.1 conserved hypothetical protein [Nitrosococcus watsonii C-113]
MVWLFLLALFLIFIVPAKFRLQTLGGIILLTLIGFFISQPEEEGAKEVRNIIPIEQIEFITVEFQPRPGVGQELVGEILNHSSYALTGLGIQLIIKDCIKNSEESQEICSVLEETRAHLSLFAPPKEKRKFKKRLYLRELHARGHIQWEYTILYTETRKRGFWERLSFFQG